MSTEIVINSHNLEKLRERKWSNPSTLVKPIKEMVRKVDECDQVHKYDWKLHTIDAIPNWLGSNQFIINGHRPPLNCVRACVWSMFRLHTDTGNIWSHIIGALLFICLGVYELNYSENSRVLDVNERLIFLVFFIGVVLCLSFSAIYHIMLCHSPPIEVIFLRLDFTGIVILIACHYIPHVYYGFYCSPKLMTFYLSVCIVLGIFTIFVLFFTKTSHQLFRGIVFAMYGSFGVIPAIHFFINHIRTTINDTVLQKSVLCLCLMMFLYYFGCLLYIQQIPEKYYPGKFDFWFHSHQLLHVIVLMALIVHYLGFNYLSEYVRQMPKHFCH